MQPHRGTLILVLGILSLIVCQILGIVPWVMANNDLKAMGAGQMDPSGRDLTTAGKICGIIALVLLIAGLIAGALIFLLTGSLAALGIMAGAAESGSL